MTPLADRSTGEQWPEPTWDALRERAMFDSHVQALMVHVHRGIDKERALIACVLELSSALKKIEAYATDLLAQGK